METTQSSRHSLKTRITLATLGVFLASLWSLSFYATRSLQHDVERLVSEQQLITADYHRLDRRHALLANAGKLEQSWIYFQEAGAEAGEQFQGSSAS